MTDIQPKAYELPLGLRSLLLQPLTSIELLPCVHEQRYYAL